MIASESERRKAFYACDDAFRVYNEVRVSADELYYERTSKLAAALTEKYGERYFVTKEWRDGELELSLQRQAVVRPFDETYVGYVKAEKMANGFTGPQAGELE